MRRRGIGVFVGCAIALLSFVAPAGATFPGRNGVIAYFRQAGLRVINPDGTGERTLRATGGYEPAWSSDGRRLAYAAVPRHFGISYGIYTVRADGSHRVRVARVAHSSVLPDPCFLPDGRIVFIDHGLVSVRPDGSHRHTIFRDRRAPHIHTIACSPDGRWIAYARRPEEDDGLGSTPIALVRPDGSDNHRITVVHQGVGVEDWSPDASRLALETGQFAVIEINPDGSNRQTIIPPSAGVYGMSYSPDGRFIAFNGPDPSPPYAALHLFDRQSGVTKTISLGAAAYPAWQSLP